MRTYKRIITFFLSFAIVLSLAAGAAFASSEIVLPPGWGRSTFWDHGKGGGFGERFSTEQDYNDYVDELPVAEIDNDGYFVWVPSHSYMRVLSGGGYQYCEHSSETSTGSTFISSFSHGSEWVRVSVLPASGSSVKVDSILSFYDVSAPVNGLYEPVDCQIAFVERRDTSGGSSYVSFNYSEYWQKMQPTSYSVGDTVRISSSGVDFLSAPYSSSFFALTDCTMYSPIFRVQPLSGLINIQTDTTYNVNTRAGSITGDYGVLGDNNTITKSDTTYIVSEDDNSVYNPVTNTTTTYDSWTYDYADRSYNFTTQEGDTTTVTYGDENVTIKEGDTTYTVYYIYQTGSGDDSGGGSGSGTVTPSDSETEQALAKLAGMLKAMLSAIPDMVKGVTEFLSQAMPWVPDEIMWLIEFGCLFAVVFAIIKAVRR